MLIATRGTGVRALGSQTRDRPHEGMTGINNITKAGLMDTITEDRRESTSIPKIGCPWCGNIMRFAGIVPTEPQRHQMLFDCVCGFEYRLSEPAKSL